MSTAIVTTQQQLIQPQAHSDNQLIALWLHGKSPHSQRAYRADVEKFTAHVAKPLQAVALANLQSFVDNLDGSDNTRKRIVSSVKSLFTFGQKLGYLQFNVAAALKAPKPKNTLAERILSESEVLAMITLTTKSRDKRCSMPVLAV